MGSVLGRGASSTPMGALPRIVAVLATAAASARRPNLRRDSRFGALKDGAIGCPRSRWNSDRSTRQTCWSLTSLQSEPLRSWACLRRRGCVRHQERRDVFHDIGQVSRIMRDIFDKGTPLPPLLFIGRKGRGRGFWIIDTHPLSLPPIVQGFVSDDRIAEQTRRRSRNRQPAELA